MPKGLSPTLTVSHPEIIAAGPLTHQPASTPYRMVLVQKRDGSFVVYTEFFTALPEDVPQLLPVPSSSFANGHYFKADQLVEATQKFAERLAAKAPEFASLYR